MDLPDVEVRVIREVNDLEELIAELTSPSCALEALEVARLEAGKSSKRVPPLAYAKGSEIRERFASALGASKTLKLITN